MINILDQRSPVDVMRDFDALPKAVREAVAAADFPFDPRLIAQRLCGRSVSAALPAISGRHEGRAL